MHAPQLANQIGYQPKMKLNHRDIVITGGTSGIGYELVRRLAPVNRRVIVLGRDPARLEWVRALSDNIITYPCSLADHEDIERTLSGILAEYPQISVVINNAAVQATPGFLDEQFCYDSIDSQIAVNLSAPIKICAQLLKPMLKLDQPCAIVNISSGLAIFPKKSSAVYCATKAGIHNFSQSLRYQLEHSEIRVFEALLPLVDTPMTAGRGRGKMPVEHAVGSIIKGIEAERYEMYIGKARFIPLLARIMPSLIARILKNS